MTLAARRTPSYYEGDWPLIGPLIVSMFVAKVPNRGSPPTFLIRESYREGGRPKSRTIANITKLPNEAIDAVRRSLAGEKLVPADDVFEIVRSRPHGDVAAVVGTIQRLGIPELLSSRKHRKRQLILAMITARILDPCSKLATAQRLSEDTLSSSLADVLGVEQADADDLYDALDWLYQGQARIEKKLAARHLEEGQRVLWDATPVPFESHTCELAAFGRPKKGKSQRQVLSGLLATRKVFPWPWRSLRAIPPIRRPWGRPWTGSRSVSRSSGSPWLGIGA